MLLARTGIFTSAFARYLPSADQFFGPSGCRINSQCLIDCQQRGFGDRTFADMYRSPVAATQTGRYAPLDRERISQACPGIVDSGLFQFYPYRLHALIRQHRDEQMTIRAILLRVKQRTQAQLALQAAEHTLKIGQHGVGAP